MNTQKQIFLIVVLLFVFTGACAAYTAIDLPIRAEDQAEWQFGESVERGALLFANNCRTCHGNAGEGGVGPVLNRDDWRDQDPIALNNNRNMIRRTITCGRAGTAMPTWGQTAGGPLNSVQVEHLVDFLTAPADPVEEGEDPEFVNKAWLEAVEFAHNLNHETAAIVGGDTLSTIASQHGIGPDVVAELNGLQPESVVDEGARIDLPPNREFPRGRTVRILNENETITRIANDFEVGAMLLADLNGIEYNYDADSNILTILVDGEPVPGLLPGEELELPDGATYTVQAGDTIESISDVHNIGAAQLRQLNPDYLADLAADEEIPAERTLELPPNPVWHAREGETVAIVATYHGFEEADLLAVNSNLTAESVLLEDEEVELPEGARYVIQSGDTLDDVADRYNSSAAEIAQFNDLQPGDPISPDVVLELPKVDAYVVQGQTLAEVAEGFANGTPAGFAQANELDDPEAPIRVGTQLTLPEDVWGTAPSISVNLGTGCTQWTLSNADYERIIGATQDITPPANVSTDIEVVANSNDWTVTADGTTFPPNEAVLLVAPGTTFDFRVDVGIHTITIEEDGEETIHNPDFRPGDTDQYTFEDVGEFTILCDFHPAMIAWVFVQEGGAAGTPAADATTSPTAAAGN